MELSKLSLFQAFWLGLNTERKARNLDEICYSQARRMWEEVQHDLASGKVEV